ncbi:uncharacterized protein LOC110941195 [Helianthus annuus]|uniref:uncharacterized protein LOC110941195 n=1 Tax=Helianthus annuus TaxID=4232 RepID=UPI0016533A7C|nr:uncharacterized protein LOC110941195 [Helianthus annuus]
MFEPDFEGRVELIAVELKKGFNLEFFSNFRVPSRAVLDAPVLGDARGILANLGKFEKRIPKKNAEKKTKRGPQQKAAVGGEPKRRRLQTKRAAPAQKKPAVAAESRDAGYSFFDFPSSPLHTAAAGAGVSKETVAPKEPTAPFVGPVRDPTVKKTVETTADQIFDTGDDISNDPSACKEILGGLGTPFEVDRARSAPRELRINQLSTMLVGSSIMANAILEDYRVLGRREDEAARLRAEAEELVRTLAKLLSDERKNWNEKYSNERKKWNESWAKQNDTLFRARQEFTNVKAANVALGREKAAAEAIAVKAQQAEALAIKALDEVKEAGARTAKALDEAKERENRISKALEEANAERTRLGRVVASLQAEVQAREVAVGDLTARVSVAEERADAAVEAKDALVSSMDQLKADPIWVPWCGYRVAS